MPLWPLYTSVLCKSVSLIFLYCPINAVPCICDIMFFSLLSTTYPLSFKNACLKFVTDHTLNSLYLFPSSSSTLCFLTSLLAFSWSLFSNQFILFPLLVKCTSLTLCFTPPCFLFYFLAFSFILLPYTYLLTRSLTYLLTYLLLLTHLLIYLLTYLLIYLLTYLFTYLLTYLFTYLLTYLLTYLPTYSLTYLLTYLFTSPVRRKETANSEQLYCLTINRS